MSDIKTGAKKTVRQLRIKHGWSQSFLAGKIYSSNSTISSIENCEYTGLQRATAERIAKAFGLAVVDIDWQGLCPESTYGRPVGSGGSAAQGSRTHSRPRICQVCFIALPSGASATTIRCDDCD